MFLARQNAAAWTNNGALGGGDLTALSFNASIPHLTIEFQDFEFDKCGKPNATTTIWG